MTSKVLLVLVVLFAAGCRSDGGIDRRDCDQGINFTLRALSRQTQDDVAETQAFFSSVPGFLSRSASSSMRNLRDVKNLYLETHETH